MRVTTLFSTRGLAALACATALAAPAAQAQQPQPTQAPREHVVREGDTLWDLARAYLNDPFRWPMIYEANRRIVENPHRIFPSEKLIIPGLTAPVDTVVVAQTEPAGPSRSRFYVGPEEVAEPTVISTELQRNAVIQPMEYLAAPWIADSIALNLNGRIVNSTDPRAAEDKLAQTFRPRDELYVSHTGAPGNPGDRVLAIRLTRSLRPHGWLVEPMGIIRIDSVGATTSRAMVTHQFSNMRVGDLTIPLPTIPVLPTALPVEVIGGPSGHIIDFLVQQPLIGTTEIGFIDMGIATGLQIGDELIAFVPERQPDKKKPEILPEELVARMVVIKLTDKTSTVRVTNLSNASLNRDLPVRVSKQTQ